MIPRNEIYDPRLTGYGTSYRSYIDDLTGRPKFYYDDIDAHTQYNYITRNKIDFTNFGQSAGPYKENTMACGTRQLADLTFHNDAMKQRTELQYRLMAKNSHREWQQRSAPIQTQGFGKAGCGCIFLRRPTWNVTTWYLRDFYFQILNEIENKLKKTFSIKLIFRIGVEDILYRYRMTINKK